MDEKEKAEPLPPNDHEFWKGAEVNTFTLRESVTCSKHFFIRKGAEAECRDCPMGYFLTPEYEVRDGRLYLHGTIVA